MNRSASESAQDGRYAALLFLFLYSGRDGVVKLPVMCHSRTDGTGGRKGKDGQTDEKDGSEGRDGNEERTDGRTDGKDGRTE